MFESAAFVKQQKMQAAQTDKCKVVFQPTSFPNRKTGNTEPCQIDAPSVNRTEITEGAGTPKKPLLNITIQKIRVQALLDNGSSLSLIDKSVFQNLNRKRLTTRPVNYKLKQACGFTEIEGAVRLTFNWPGGCKRQRFLIVENLSQSVILGRDFLANEDLILHTRSGGWTCGTQLQKVIPFNEEDKTCTEEGTYVSETKSSPFSIRDVVEATSCSPEEKSELAAMLSEYKHIFTAKPGCTDKVVHEINTGTANAVKCHPRPMSQRKRELFDAAFDQLLEQDLIEKSESAWCSPTVLVETEGKEPRLCLDARRLNAVTKADSYPMASIPDIIGHLGNVKYFSVLDLSKGYLQIKISERDRCKTAFASHRGLYQYKRLCFGLRNAPATFQRFVDTTLGDCLWQYCLPYLDDLVIFSKTFKEHIQHLKNVLAKLDAAHLTVNPKKVQICCPEIRLLGFIIKPGSCSPNPDKLAALRNFPSPKKVEELQRVLGMLNFYRTGISEFAQKAMPLYNLLKKQTKWEWTNSCEQALRGLIKDLETNSELRLPDLNQKFIIQSDASAFAIAAVLLQETPNGLKPISFISRTLTSAERNYTTMEREGLAAIYALRKFRMYIEYAEIEIQTDNMALSWIRNLKEPAGRLARWALELSAYNCTITHLPGRKNQAADAFSRIRLDGDEGEPAAECVMIQPDSFTQQPTGLPVTRAMFIEEQHRDPKLAKYFAMWDGRTTVKDDTSVGIKTTGHVSDRYIVENDGLLLGYFPSEPGKEKEPLDDWKIVVPRSLRAKVINYFHSTPTSGHFMTQKTFKRLCQRVTWRGMKGDVHAFCKACDPCQKTKAATQKPAGLMQSVTSTRPFEVIALDEMGPYTKSIDGTRHLLVIMDHFTKWVEIFPIRKLSTRVVWKALREWCNRYGYPRTLIADNASIHRSNLHNKYCSEYGIKTHYITPFHSQANVTERHNRSLK